MQGEEIRKLLTELDGWEVVSEHHLKKHYKFGDFREALAFVNASDFGLQAGVFTRDLGLALRAFDALDVGGVLINEVPTFRVENIPYGGIKDSGFGREGVRYAMEEMTELKSLIIKRG